VPRVLLQNKDIHARARQFRCDGQADNPRSNDRDIGFFHFPFAHVAEHGAATPGFVISGDDHEPYTISAGGAKNLERRGRSW